jgi:SAM-dependent methyltransferase
VDSAQNVEVDPLTEFDWAAHWRHLVEAREAQFGRGRSGFWDKVAPSFPQTVRADDPLLPVLEPYLSPERTLIDVGAGTGRYTIPLIGRLDWVTAVEPSEAMRSQIPAAPNLTVVGSSWEDAQVAPADLVICSHVLYMVTDTVPFLAKLAESARERVFVLLRDAPMDHPANHLWELFAGDKRLREPCLYDAYNLLRQLGIHPDAAMSSLAVELSFASFEAAVEDARYRVGPAWRDAEGRAWLADRLQVGADGRAVYRGRDGLVGVLHWRPSR